MKSGADETWMNAASSGRELELLVVLDGSITGSVSLRVEEALAP